jgi:hypothetical protein
MRQIVSSRRVRRSAKILHANRRSRTYATHRQIRIVAEKQANVSALTRLTRPSLNMALRTTRRLAGRNSTASMNFPVGMSRANTKLRCRSRRQPGRRRRTLPSTRVSRSHRHRRCGRNRGPACKGGDGYTQYQRRRQRMPNWQAPASTTKARLEAKRWAASEYSKSPVLSAECEAFKQIISPRRPTSRFRIAQGNGYLAEACSDATTFHRTRLACRREVPWSRAGRRLRT